MSEIPVDAPFDDYLGRPHGGCRLARLDGMIFVAYLLLVAAYFSRPLLTGELPGQAVGDMLINWVWQRDYLGAALREGTLPLYNPYMMSGFPFLAGGQTAIFYPLNWLFAIVPTVPLLTLQCALHFWAALVAVHWLGRRLGFSSPACVIAALGFVFSGFSILHLSAGHLPFVLAAPWTPLLLLAWIGLQSATQRAPRGAAPLPYALLLAFVAAMQLLTGQPQITYYSLFLLGILHAGWGVWMTKSARLAWPGFIRGTAWMAGGLLFSLLLVAVQYLPVVAFIQESIRGRPRTVEQLLVNSLPPEHLPMMAAPFAYGNSPSAEPLLYAGNVTETASYHEVCCYLGAGLLILALGAMCTGTRKGAGFRWSLAAAALVSLWMAVGRHGGLYELLLAVLPGLSLFRCPGRFTFVTTLAVSLLAAGGFDRLRVALTASRQGPGQAPMPDEASEAMQDSPPDTTHNSPEDKRPISEEPSARRFVLAGFCLLPVALIFVMAVSGLADSDARLRSMLLGLPNSESLNESARRYVALFSSSMIQALAVALGILVCLILWRRMERVMTPALVFLVAAELLVFAETYRTSFSMRKYLWPEQLTARLRAEGGRWRMGSCRETSDMMQGMTTGVRHVWGAEPLLPERYSDAMMVAQRLHETRAYPPQIMSQIYRTPFTRALGMRWLLGPEGIASSGKVWRVAQDGPGYRLLEDREALPRGYAVPSWRLIEPGRAASLAVNDDAFDPSREVLIAGPVAMSELPDGVAEALTDTLTDTVTTTTGGTAETTATEYADSPSTGSGAVIVIRDETDLFEARVAMREPGWFVLMDQFFPGWSVTVDDRPDHIYLANAVGRAVPLSAGEHIVAMTYQAPGLRAGIVVSVCAWLAWFVLVLQRLPPCRSASYRVSSRL